MVRTEYIQKGMHRNKNMSNQKYDEKGINQYYGVRYVRDSIFIWFQSSKVRINCYTLLNFETANEDELWNICLSLDHD